MAKAFQEAGVFRLNKVELGYFFTTSFSLINLIPALAGLLLMGASVAGTVKEVERDTTSAVTTK